MNIETLIYAYLAICFSIIVFNISCVFLFKRNDRKLMKKSEKLTKKIAFQLDRIRKGLPVEEHHNKYLKKALKKTLYLMAFDEAVFPMYSKQKVKVRKYLEQIHPAFIAVSASYTQSDSVRSAYFMYIICRYGIVYKKPSDPLTSQMFGMLKSKAIYCRVNALNVMFSTGDCNCILKALKIMDTENEFNHPKMITDGLLTFAGDSMMLERLLWEHFYEFSVPMRVNILNYIRFGGHDHSEKFLKLMNDSHQDDEIRFACIRYFGKHYYEPAFPVLIDFASDNKKRWEYRAISASTLAFYPGTHTVDVLKELLHSSMWYVRLNASESLKKLDFTYMDAIDIFDGDDRYAHEILQYRLDQIKFSESEGITV